MISLNAISRSLPAYIALAASFWIASCASAPTRDQTPPPSPPAAASVDDKGGAPRIPVRSDDRAWLCKVNAGSHEFESYGQSQLQARQMTIQKCIHENAPKECQAVKCKAKAH